MKTLFPIDRWWLLVTKLWQLAMLLVKFILYQNQHWFLVQWGTVTGMSGYLLMRLRCFNTGEGFIPSSPWWPPFFLFMVASILFNLIHISFWLYILINLHRTLCLLWTHVLWLHASYLVLWSHLNSFTSLLSTVPNYDLLFVFWIDLRSVIDFSEKEVEALSENHDLCVGGDCIEMLQQTSAVLQVIPYVKVLIHTYVMFGTGCWCCSLCNAYLDCCLRFLQELLLSKKNWSWPLLRQWEG